MKIDTRGRTFSIAAAFVMRKVPLLRRAGTQEKDIESLFCALRQIVYRRDAWNAYESPQQIGMGRGLDRRFRIQWSDPPALNPSLNEFAGCFQQLRGASDNRIQGWGR
jgi:hypothetical protein